jgi:electron transfer flavoprotein beta subunit
MKIAVCVKTITGAAVDAEDGFLRAGRTLPSVLPSFDAHAVEEAVRIRERGEGGDEIVLVSIGPREGLGGLRQALAMGADRAVLLSDPLLARADLTGISRLLAALLRREAPDLALFCPWSGDLDGSMLATMAAARLSIPCLGQLRSLMVADGRVRGERQAEDGDQWLAANMPCIVQINESINKPRNVTLKARQHANAKPVQLLSIADLLPDKDFRPSETSILAQRPAPMTRKPLLIQGDDAPEKVIGYLREQRLLP